MNDSMVWMLANGYEFSVKQNPQRISVLNILTLTSGDIDALVANWKLNGLKTSGLTLEGHL